MARLGVVRAVATNDVHWRAGWQLAEQVRQDVGIADILMGHQRRAYLAALGVHRQMNLAPGAPLGITVLAHFPFAFTKYLQAGAVDHQMQRLPARSAGKTTSRSCARLLKVV